MMDPPNPSYDGRGPSYDGFALYHILVNQSVIFTNNFKVKLLFTGVKNWHAYSQLFVTESKHNTKSRP